MLLKSFYIDGFALDFSFKKLRHYANNYGDVNKESPALAFELLEYGVELFFEWSRSVSSILVGLFNIEFV